MKSISYFCQGESHKASGKPCQDYALDYDTDRSFGLAIVCDGHGGERYFRSNIGSKLLAKITKEALIDFVKNMPNSTFTPEGKNSVFEDEPYTAYSEAISTPELEKRRAHKALQWLFSSIVSQWNIAIEKHALETKLTAWELEHVNQKYLDEFTAKLNNADRIDGFEKTYGCTLMAYVQTRDYWFGFHLGDGKCISLHKDKTCYWKEPIPWDDKCFLNKTTSICDSNALKEFRYAYQGNGEFPMAVFLGSDGLDDSYGEIDNLASFYATLYKQIMKSGYMDVLGMLRKDLPKISKRGSQDDMSIAAVYDESQIKENFRFLNEMQQEVQQQKGRDLEKQIIKFQEKIGRLTLCNDENSKIELSYAKKNLEKCTTGLDEVKVRINKLKEELYHFENKYAPVNTVKLAQKKVQTLKDLRRK